MTELDSVLDGVVRKIKSCEGLEGLRFVRALSSKAPETPLIGCVASVGYTKAERSAGFLGGLVSPGLRGELISADVVITLYAPFGESGGRLTELAGRVAKALRDSDGEGIISDVRIHPVELEPDLNTIFRRIEFSLEFCLVEEAKDE